MGLVPASSMQRMLWLSEQITLGAPTYNLPRVLVIRGTVDIDALRASFQTLLRRHGALRTSFFERDGDIFQEVQETVTIELPTRDLTYLPSVERTAEAQRLAEEEARTPFDLSRAPLIRLLLLRLEDERHLLLLVIHHIISDGWSMSIIFDEIAEIHGSISKGHRPNLPPLRLQFADFAHWEQEHLTEQALAPDIAYWRARLRDCPKLLELPIDYARPAISTHRGALHCFTIKSDLVVRLEEASRRERATLYMALLAVFQILLSRYGGGHDILVGTPVAGRNDPELSKVVGCFVNTLVMRTDLSGDPGFSEVLGRVREVALGAFAHQDLPFQRLLTLLPAQREGDHAPILQVMFILQNGPKQVVRLRGLEIEELEFCGGMAKFDLTLEVVPRDNELYCQFEYSTELFEAATVERMSRHFMNILSGALDAPLTSISRLPLLDREERAHMLVEWNRTDSDYPRRQRIDDAFAAEVRRHPDSVALIEAGCTVSYAELDRRANQIAHALLLRNTPQDPLIGVHLGRSVDSCAAVLGILKAGYAYVPLDTAQPTSRLHRLIADCGCGQILTWRRLRAALPETVEAILLDAGEAIWSGPPSVTPARAERANELAYVVYTSGSAGDPKGVMGTHRATMNRLHWMYRAYPFASEEVCCQKTPLGFVDSIWEMLGPLLRGIPIVIVNDDDVMDPARLITLLAKSRVTRIVLVPTLLRMLLDHAPDLGARLPRLRHWTTSGEYLAPDLARRFRAACPEALLLNLYGSSEVAADATGHEVRELRGNEPVPIGKPISNTRVYILDSHMEPVPVGVAGQIFVGGDCLSAGYWRRPDLTAERFLPCPFDEGSSGLFATGDRGRFLADGSIEYLGRQDGQVKIRGYRVELGEVEVHLAAHPDVRQVAVASTSGPLAEPSHLVAYVVGREAAAPRAEELRAFLGTRLPRYMVPAIFVEMRELPMLPSGKIDRRALPEPPTARAHLAPHPRRPRNKTEAKLISFWLELLHLREVALNQNFFDLGGDSLLAMQLLGRIRRQFHVDVPIRGLFETPTIEGLVRMIEVARDNGATPRRSKIQPRPMQEPGLDVLAAELNKLSPEQIELLLQQVRRS
jgi:amino acid adenylation domain-containing protein